MSLNHNHFDVVIVGGGLAGLSAAAFLAHKGKKIAVLERGVLGGRAVTLPIKGFHFNFGAHAIYGRDHSILRYFEKELGLSIDWRDFQPSKAKYDIGDEVTDVPANIQGLFRTKVLAGLDKLSFTFNILKTMLKLETGHPHLSISKWLEKKEVADDVREMMLTLASSNFFTKEPEAIPSDVFFRYYSRLFLTNKPVAYIGGGWQALIQELVRVIEQHNGAIFTKTKIDGLAFDGDRVTSVQAGEETFTADRFIMCIPPKELQKIVQDSSIAGFVQQYASYDPTYVMVYDIGLKTRIESPYTYIYDKQNNLFITDISYYDTSCTPPGGQLLQATAYLRQEDMGNKDVLESYKQKIEQLYDKHFPGWREELVVPRMSQRAVVQEIKWTMHQQAMPVFFPEYRNLFFAGDWCQGQGQLSELSFSSALSACEMILQH